MASYGNQYNTRRQSNRSYNTAGQFVPAESAPPPMPASPAPVQSAALNNMRLTTQINNLHTIQTTDIEMKPDVSESKEDATRPAWMKPRLAGVKKISNKERRRRQNASLRRLLTPKNALMVLNEMLPGEQLASQYSVEACGPYALNQYGNKPAAFVAELRLQGQCYQGHGDTKMAARNAVAEQAIRDLVIKRMMADSAKEAEGANGAGEGDGEGGEESQGEGGDESQLPMMQLASFALHKLFSEWEYEGHRVPHLKPPKISESGAVEEVITSGGTVTAGRGAATRPGRALPCNASTMHPCMLLTYMRPSNVYKDMPHEGDRPSNTIFNVAVDVDNFTYTGKGSNKKEARRAAARAACEALFGVTFAQIALETKPVLQ